VSDHTPQPDRAPERPSVPERAELFKAGILSDARVRLANMGWRSTLPAAGAIIIGIGFLVSIRAIARPIGFLIIAIALAEALAPLVGLLERHVRRAIAIVIVYMAVVGTLGFLSWLVVPTLISQVQELVARAPELIQRVESLMSRQGAMSVPLAEAAHEASRRVAGLIFQLPLMALSALVNVSVVLFLSVYWLIGGRALLNFTLSLIPVERHAATRSVLQEMGQSMGGYVRGAAINAVIMGTIAYAALTAIGVNYALALGVITMLAEPIPIIGPILAAVPVVLVALLQSPTLALLALGLYTVLQQLEGQLLTPNIMRSQTDIPQTVVLFAVMAGAAIGGLLGVLAAIPAAAAIRVFLVRVLAPVIKRWTGADYARAQGHLPVPPEPRPAE
jgi:predicted PurR-regulated permease PerM